LEVINQYRYFSIRVQQHDWETNLGAQQVYIQACPKQQPIGLVLSPIEGQEMILTLIDTTGTIKTEAHKQLVTMRLFDENQLGTITSKLKDWLPYANLRNKRLIIERHQWPKNLLAIGDSICYQNPVYGQGLTVILKQVQVLKQANRRNWVNQKQLHRRNWLPWIIASNQDRQGDSDTIFQWFLKKLLQHAVIDPAVGKIFIQILHQKISPLHLLHPKLLAKLIWKEPYD
jgi:hypothetical protein